MKPISFKIIILLLIIISNGCEKKDDQLSTQACFGENVNFPYRFKDPLNSRLIFFNQFEDSILWNYSIKKNQIKEIPLESYQIYQPGQIGINFKLNELYRPVNNVIYINDINSGILKDSIVIENAERISSCASEDNILFIISENHYYNFQTINRNTKEIIDSEEQGVYGTKIKSCKWFGKYKIYGLSDGAFFNYVVDLNGNIIEQQTKYEDDFDEDVGIAPDAYFDIISDGNMIISNGNVFDSYLNYYGHVNFSSFHYVKTENVIYAGKYPDNYVYELNFPDLQVLDSIEVQNFPREIYVSEGKLYVLETDLITCIKIYNLR